MPTDYEELFEKPLSEYSDEELLELANETRTRRKYPAVEQKTSKQDNAIDDLVSKYTIKKNKADEEAK